MDIWTENINYNANCLAIFCLQVATQKLISQKTIENRHNFEKKGNVSLLQTSTTEFLLKRYESVICRLHSRNQTRWGTYCCMNPKMMGATCTNRLRLLLAIYHVLKFLDKGLKIHCDFWKVSITITLLFFLEYQIEFLNQMIFSLFF